MNRLVIIGNGFDMAHGLKTSYMDFIKILYPVPETPAEDKPAEEKPAETENK